MFVCISTKDRDRFYEWTYRMVIRQTLQPVGVVIVDGTVDPSPYWSTWPGAIYLHHPNIALGASRNLALSTAVAAGAENVAIWDDDDYYAEWHLEHAQRLLMEDPSIMAVGSSLTPVYFPHYDELWLTGPFMDTHALEPTLVCRAALLHTHAFDDTDTKGLGSIFLNGYTVPLTQMWGSHILISHTLNTVSKEAIRFGSCRGRRSYVPIPEALADHPAVRHESAGGTRAHSAPHRRPPPDLAGNPVPV
jgi:hypothetical protein